MSTIEGQNASTSLAAGSAGLATGNVADCGAVYLNIFGVITSSATLTAGTILIEGSVDGVNWYTVITVAANTITAAGNTAYSGPPATLAPARFIRARISVAIVGGTISVAVGAAGT